MLPACSLAVRMCAKRLAERNCGAHCARRPLMLLFISSQDVHRWRHAILIDAGSTGTRLHVFRYRPWHVDASGSAVPVWPRIDVADRVFKASPGLSAHAANPKAAAKALRGLMEQARAHVPPAAWRRTPVALMATAGAYSRCYDMVTILSCV